MKPQAWQACLQLMRLDKPIGICLLLWPTLWALCMATHGHWWVPESVIFVAGVIVMRSVGCVMNDLADRRFDAHVQRTAQRPLATNVLSVNTALALIVILLGMALWLVLHLNRFAVLLSFPAVGLAAIYPLMKRVTYWPQVVLGAAFNWGIVMVYAALQQQVPAQALWLFLLGTLWTVIYDTMYAMTDRADDLKIGIKSTAILFAEHDVTVLTMMYAVLAFGFGLFGWRYHLHSGFYAGFALALLLAVYQLRLIRHRDPSACFHAFKHNNWFGLVMCLALWLGIRF